ncbi:MAG: DMT family transporter [Trueperaceae bacterium]
MSFTWGVLTLVAINLIWGTSFAITKNILDTVPVALLVALRSSLGLLSLLWIRPVRSAIKPGLLLGVFAVGGFIAQMIGLTTTTASKSAFITALSALAAPLISAWIFKHFVPRRAYVATFLALLGLACMTLVGQQTVNPGDLWTVVAALFFGAYIAYASEVANKTSVLSLVQMQFVVMTVVTLLWAWPQLPEVTSLSSAAWTRILYLSILCMSVPTVLQVWAQRVVPSYLAALLFILEPVFASFFAFLWLGESFRSLDWFGASLVLVALLVCTLPLSNNVVGKQKVEG